MSYGCSGEKKSNDHSCNTVSEREICLRSFSSSISTPLVNPRAMGGERGCICGPESTLLKPAVTCVPVEAGLEMSPSEHSSRHLVLRASSGLPRLDSDFSCGRETARAPGDGTPSNYIPNPEHCPPSLRSPPSSSPKLIQQIFLSLPRVIGHP